MKDKCYALNPLDAKDDFNCHQEEADTRLFYHATLLTKRDDVKTILIDAEDTDVIVIASYASHQLDKKLCIYKRGKIFSASDLLPSAQANVIIPFHAITGADTISGFYGQSKKAIFKRLMKHEDGTNEFLETLGKLEIQEDIDDKNSEMFLLKIIYNDQKNNKLSVARASKWKSMKNKSTARLPPDKDSYRQHVYRAHHQATVWYSF